MLVLRTLSLPVALFTFAVLFSVSIKAPQMVESSSLLLWVALLAVLLAKLIRRLA